LAPKYSSNPSDPHYSRDYSICNLALDCIPSEHQSQTTIDDAQGQNDSAPPDVRCRPDYAFAVLLVNVVMEEATDGLEEKRTNNDYADSWMAIAGFKLESKGKF